MTDSSGRSRAAGETRLVVVVGIVVFVDTMFYAVVAPLLPGLAHQLHLSRLSAGVLAASYAIGTLAGSIPGGVLAVRAGPRATVGTGLTLLACSTLGFGLLNSAPALDAARFVEGVGGACSWAGGLAWIVAAEPPDRRGAMIGRALAAAIGGSLLGPAIGALATATGRAGLFSGLAALVVVVIAWTRTLPAPGTTSGQGAGAAVRALRVPAIATGMWLMLVPAIASGLINVLGPLRLHRLGAGAAAIGATFLVAAAVEGCLAPVIGGVSDRHGRLAPLRGGLFAASAALVAFTLPDSPLLLAGLVVVAGGSLGACFAPAMAMLADAAEALGLDQGFAAALMNLAWAGGQIIGAAGGGAVAKVSGDLTPTLVAAGLCAVTLVTVRTARSGSPERALGS